MTDRMPVIAGNWKMHHNHLEAIQVVQKLSYRLENSDYERCEVVVCPAFTALRSVQTVINSDDLKIKLGAQNVYYEKNGAYTGEVSPEMLAKLDVSYVIVGHSERRELFGETDEIVARKVRAVLGAGMDVILCCGETLEEREGGRTEEKVRGQVDAAVNGLKAADMARVVIAYEPIWAIGTGRNATPQDADATCGVIRTVLQGHFGDQAEVQRVLYGGSVKPGNISELMAMPHVDGALVGGASLDPDDFARIVKYR
jgi:triosephosphate isomerase (TIM)